MSIRTTEAAVLIVLGSGTTATETDLVNFVLDASIWVDNYLDGKCTAVDAEKLEIVERYLAAHLFTVSQSRQPGQLVSANRSDVSERYAETRAADGNTTMFARIAAGFDECGIVAKHWLDKPRLKFRVGSGWDPRHSARTG